MARRLQAVDGRITFKAGLRSFDSWVGVTRSASASENARPENFSPDKALQLVPIQGAVGALARGAATSELQVQEKQGGVWVQTHDDLPRWADPAKRPSHYQSQYEFMYHLATNLLVGGNGFVQIRSRRMGEPDHILSIPNGLVTVPYDTSEVLWRSQELFYWVNGMRQSAYGVYNLGGQVLHLRLITREGFVLGASPLMISAPPLRIGLAADAHAELLFQQGGMPPGILYARNDEVGEETIKDVRAFYDRIRENPNNRHRPLIMEGDWGWLSTHVNPDQLQLIDSRKFTYDAASALYGVPISLFGNPESGTPGTAYKPLIHFMSQNSLQPLLKLIGTSLSELLPEGRRCRIVPEHLLETNALEQSRVWERLVKLRIITRNEVRTKLGLPEVEGLDDEPLPAEGSGRGLEESAMDGADSDSSKDRGTTNRPDSEDE